MDFFWRTSMTFTNEEADYALTKPRITGKTVVLNIPWSDFVLPAKLPAGVQSVEGRVLIGNPVKCRLTATQKIGDDAGISHWTIRLESGSSVGYSKSGAMQIHVTTQNFEVVLRVVARHFFTPGLRVNANKIRTTRMDVQLNINRYLILEELVRRISRAVPATVATASYEPELFTGAFVKWKRPAMTFIFFTNGTILVRGVSDFSAIPLTVKRIVAEAGPANIFKKERGPFGSEYARIARPPPTARQTQRANKLNARYPRAQSYSNTRNGFYVRPGPNAVPRFYPVVANMGLVRQKALRAYANAGVNVPVHVRNLLGGGEAVLVAKKSPPRRAPNWNANRPGYYVRPGPGKQPYFYKIPKGLAAGRKTVLKAYTDAGVRVPARVRNIFGLPGNGESPLTPTYVIKGNKINGKQYQRYTIAQLVGIARLLKIPEASENKTAAQLFALIKNKAGGGSASSSPRTPNVTVNGRTYRFTNGLDTSIVRNGRSRQFHTLTRAERLAIAKAYLANNALYANFEKTKPKNWYISLKAVKASRGSPSSVNSAYIRSVINELSS